MITFTTYKYRLTSRATVRSADCLFGSLGMAADFRIGFVDGAILKFVEVKTRHTCAYVA